MFKISLVVILLIGLSQGDQCNCAITIPWLSNVFACGSNARGSYEFNSTYQNLFCDPNSMRTQFSCIMGQRQFEIAYPGKCGCPNDCFQNLNQGVCKTSSCVCNTGYSGLDCSLVNEKNNCTGRGTYNTETNSCDCELGYTLWDCSGNIVERPMIPQTIAGERYTDWDKYGDNHPLFNLSTIAQISLQMDPVDLDKLLDPLNLRLDDYKLANLTFQNENIYENLDGVGIKLSGSLGRSYSKKSFKIKFNFGNNQGKKIYQQKAINLKSAQIEPTFAREIVSISVAWSMLSPVQRSSLALLYINDKCYGIYVLLETIDSQFMKSRFGEDESMLYKCSSVFFIPQHNPNLLLSAFQPQTNASYNYTRLIQLMNVVLYSPDDQFKQQIQGIFDVEMFFRTLSVEVLTSNFDGFGRNNYYLYFNPNTQKFQYFRHDFDFSMGVFSPPNDIFATFNVYNGSQILQGARLIGRMVQNFPDIWTQHLSSLLSSYFMPSGPIIKLLDTLLQLITPIVPMDNWHSFDSLWSQNDTTNNYYNSIHQGDPLYSIGLMPFIQLRSQSALQQLNQSLSL